MWNFFEIRFDASDGETTDMYLVLNGDLMDHKTAPFTFSDDQDTYFSFGSANLPQNDRPFKGFIYSVILFSHRTSDTEMTAYFYLDPNGAEC